MACRGHFAIRNHCGDAAAALVAQKRKFNKRAIDISGELYKILMRIPLIFLPTPGGAKALLLANGGFAQGFVFKLFAAVK